MCPALVRHSHAPRIALAQHRERIDAGVVPVVEDDPDGVLTLGVDPLDIDPLLAGHGLGQQADLGGTGEDAQVLAGQNPIAGNKPRIRIV